MNKIISSINENFEDMRSSLKEYGGEQLIPLFRDFTNENIKILHDRKTELNNRYLPQMKALKWEGDHDEADLILCHILEELGFYELTYAYHMLPKWYS